MTLRISTGMRNHLLAGGSLKNALSGGRMEIYSGTQPASADAAKTGTLLVTITNAGGSWTAETPATASIELTSGSSGSVDNVTVDSVSILDTVVPYNTSLAQTATDLAAALNRSTTNLDWIATASSATVTLTAKPGRGARFNGKTLATTLTTLAATDTNPASGAAGANGLNFEDASAGAVAKRAAQTWSGTAVADGTAGWFRFYGPHADSGSADATGEVIRMDGAIATSGQQLNMSPTAIVSSAVQTVGSFSPTIPASL